MGIELLIKAYSDYLNTLNIHVLRNVARHLGVYKPTEGRKKSVIERMIAVLIGTVLPVPPSKLGAPLKEDALDPKYIRELDRIRSEYEQTTGNLNSFTNVLSVGSEDARPDEYEQPLFMGILEVMPNGCGYLRVENCQVTAGKDVFVSSQNMRAWNLKEGDYVVGYARTEAGNNNPSLTKVLSVNEVMQYQSRKAFEDFSACYPEEKIEFSKETDSLSLRYIDLFSPIGKGQRVMVTVPATTDCNILFKDIARSLRKKIDAGENFHLLTLLLDERPEEITEFRCAVSQELIYTTFDKAPSEHLRVAKLVFSRAKRLAEMGVNVVLLLNSLTRLVYASNNCITTGNPLPGALTPSAFALAKTCLSQAVNLKGGGSITVLAAVDTHTGSALDAIIFSEFEKICNAHIALSGKRIQRGEYPLVDIKNSYTVRAERLLSPVEADALFSVREKLLVDDEEALYAFIKQTPDNLSFVNKILNKK